MLHECAATRNHLLQEMKTQPTKFFALILTLLIGTVVLLNPEASRAEVCKVRISGGGNAWWTGAANKYAILTVEPTNKVTIKQSTLVSNMITGLGKWWDHTVTASRACPLKSDGWDNSQDCIQGQGIEIQIPIGKSIKEYSYQFKWSENGGTQTITIDLNNAVPEKEK